MLIPDYSARRAPRGRALISGGMATAVILGLVAVAALVALLAFVLPRRRSRPEETDRLAEAVDDMRLRMDELVHDLSDALERAERESRRNRLLGELGASIDLEELVDRVLDAALEIPGFDAAMVTLDEGAGAPLVATRGMTPEEAARPPSSGGSGAPAGTITVTYRYGPEQEGNGSLIRGGLFVPMEGRELRALGTLALFWRTAGWEPPRDQIDSAENLAASSVPAIENARRYREARQLAETDALTGLFNQRYFHETLRREVLRAQRYGRNLALIVFDLDDFKHINDRIGHLAGDSVLAQAAERVRDSTRSVDIACRIGGDEFAVIMPESTEEDAKLLYSRVSEAVRTTSFGAGGHRLRLSAGIAELGHGDTAASLFERADAALYRAKDRGKDRADTAPGLGELSS
jgi:diguanylate cyclase (GGDEF)-like protein